MRSWDIHYQREINGDGMILRVMVKRGCHQVIQRALTIQQQTLIDK